MVKDINGIWIGENATVAIIDEYRITFIRINNELIASILHHHVYGTIGVVYGFGMKPNAYCFVSAKNPITGELFYSSEDAKNYNKNHLSDKIEYDEKNIKLTYIMFDGKKFDLILAEKINISDFEEIHPVDNTMPIEKKMALWNIGKYFEYNDGFFDVMISTQKYSILFSFSIKDSWVYCRVGQNGYCKKGWAMLSTICLRQNQVRMIKNNLSSINDYKPVEDCFVVDGCAFPPDGGWYWSLKEVTDDVIYLSGCEEKIYEIRRKKNMIKAKSNFT